MKLRPATPCERLPITATKQQREALHRAKMADKARRRSLPDVPPAHVPANLSRNHPDHGLSMRDHEAKKRARKAP
jgi:hypothetical protein